VLLYAQKTLSLSTARINTILPLFASLGFAHELLLISLSEQVQTKTATTGGKSFSFPLKLFSFSFLIIAMLWQPAAPPSYITGVHLHQEAPVFCVSSCKVPQPVKAEIAKYSQTFVEKVIYVAERSLETSQGECGPEEVDSANMYVSGMRMTGVQRDSLQNT
jgi:hypothetical protein